MEFWMLEMVRFDVDAVPMYSIPVVVRLVVLAPPLIVRRPETEEEAFEVKPRERVARPLTVRLLPKVAAPFVSIVNAAVVEVANVEGEEVAM